MVELPRAGRSLSQFADDVGRLLSRNGVYIMDGTPVVPDPISGALEVLDADCLRTYAEKTLLPAVYRRKKGEDEGELVVSTMSREEARGVLRSHHFRAHQRVVTVQYDAPVPVMRPCGKIELLEVGWDARTGVLITEGKK
jgi:hypothetical protein